MQKFGTRDDKIISPESQVALADIYVNNDQTDKAIETLKKAAEMADSPLPEQWCQHSLCPSPSSSWSAPPGPNKEG